MGHRPGYFFPGGEPVSKIYFASRFPPGHLDASRHAAAGAPMSDFDLPRNDTILSE